MMIRFHIWDFFVRSSMCSTDYHGHRTGLGVPTSHKCLTLSHCLSSQCQDVLKTWFRTQSSPIVQINHMQQGARSIFFFSWNLRNSEAPQATMQISMWRWKGWLGSNPLWKSCWTRQFLRQNFWKDWLMILVSKVLWNHMTNDNGGGLVTHWPGHLRCTMHMTAVHGFGGNHWP